MTDYYTVLGVNEDCEISDINNAYKKLALKWHPDRNDSKEAIDKFNKAAEAYETLSNPIKRKKFDQYRRKKSDIKATTVLRFTSDNANDVFKKMFGKTNIENILKHATSSPNVNVIHHNSPNVHKKNTLVNTADVTEAGKPIKCPLEDLYTGKRRIVKLEGHAKMVIVEVPMGCEDGYLLPVINPVNSDITHFSIHAQKHSIYWRIKDNLHMNHELDLKEYVNGFTVVITLLDGRKKKISHSYGGKIIGPDLVMRIPNLGMPKFETSDYGDLYMHFKLNLPKNI